MAMPAKQAVVVGLIASQSFAFLYSLVFGMYKPCTWPR
jgi:hypothetical protein